MNELPFDAVYAGHLMHVRRLLQRLGVRAADLDDAVQDTFVTIHRLLPGFEGRAALQTWLYAICWRVAAGYHRRARSWRQLVHTDDGSEPCIEAPPATFGPLHASLVSIEPADRDLLALHDIGGLSIAELSELTGAARATIRRHLERARAALDRLLAQRASAQDPGNLQPIRRFRAHMDGWCRSKRTGFEYASADWCFSRSGDTVLARWRGPISLQALEVVSEMLLHAAAETPQGINFLSVFEPSSTPPDREAREALGWIAEKVGRQLNAAAFATRSPGLFRVLPPIINAYVYLAGSPIRLRYFTDTAPAVAWLAQFSHGASETKLLAHVERMGRRIDEHATRPKLRMATGLRSSGT